MDYGRSFVFMFRDRDWPAKIIIGGVFTLLSAILIGIPFVLGYILEVIRSVAAGRDEPLPAWDNLGDKFVQGLVPLVIGLILAIPLVLLSCISSVFNSIIAGSQGDALVALLWLVNIAVWLLSLLYGILYAAFFPALMIRYAMTRDFGATFRFGPAWDLIRANFGNYILVVIVAYLAQVVASFGVILCVIGVFVTIFWAYLVQAHLLGQYYRNFVVGGVAPLDTPVAPL